MGLTFVRGSGLGLIVYSNAEDAGKSNDRRLVSRTVITLAGSSVSWASSTQRCVTLSTAEAEYIVDIHFVASEEQHTDPLTKSLAANPFKPHRRFLLNLPLEGE